MIRLGDALVLAGTKLRTHKIRTGIAIGLSSILFAVLVAAIVLAQGTINSLNAFNNQALNGRYLVLATTNSIINYMNGAGSSSLTSPQTLALAKQVEPQIIAAKVKDAALLGVPYNPENEPPAVNLQENIGHPSTEHLNFTASYAAQQALMQYIRSNPAPGVSQLKQTAAPYHPKAIYIGQPGGVIGGSVEIMPNGTEDFAATDDEKANLDFFFRTGMDIDDQGLVTPFISPGVKIDKNAVPIIAPYDAVERMLGLTPLSSKATSRQQYDRIKELYQSIAKQQLIVTTCYRNNISSGQITQALDYIQNSDNKDYQKPDVIYGLPDANSCSAAPIISDSRTEAQKKQQAAEDQFSVDFGGIVYPAQQKISFQVIGLTPTVDDSSTNTTFGSLLGKITGSSLGEVYSVPSNLLDQVSNAAVIKAIFLNDTQAGSLYQALTDPSTNYGYTVEFSSADDARRFINDEGCQQAPTGGICAKFGEFHLSTVGNNSIALQDLQNKMINILLIGAAAVVILAIIIMTAMIGRAIGDSRHETAVFRALGAKRGDISVIYTIYTLWISAIIAAIALVLGILAIYILNVLYENEATLQAKLLFDAVSTNLKFDFFAVNPYILATVVVLVLLTGLVSMVVPLLRNIPRSPIKDMREE